MKLGAQISPPPVNGPCPLSIHLEEVLRARRIFPAEEASLFLEGLPKVLDHARVGERAIAWRGRLALAFEGRLARSALLEALARPAPEWPPFRWVILERPAHEDDDDFTAGEETDELPGEGGAPVQFAELLYEVLAGRAFSSTASSRFGTLRKLGETANALLRRALLERDFETCEQFWAEWQRALEAPAESGAGRLEFTIPARFLACAQPGALLMLTPNPELQPPIRLVARDFFKIGRSRGRSDFPVRSDDGEPSLEPRAKRVSRVHVLGEFRGEDLTIRDGDGLKPSKNGSLYNGRRLDAEIPLKLGEQRGVLSLGDFQLQIIPVPHYEEKSLTVSNLREWRGPQLAGLDGSETDAVIFVPLNGWALTHNAVWLLRQVGFDLTAEGTVLWHEDGLPGVAYFLHLRGCFWCANFSLRHEMRLDNLPVAPGEIVPLVRAQVLQLKSARFIVEVE